jgi:outer membrane protein OmpA-like peptidoglycan-associated protein
VVGLSLAYRHRESRRNLGWIVVKALIEAKISLSVVVLLTLALAGCQTADRYASPSRQPIARTATARPAPVPRRTMSSTQAPRQLPGIRPFTRDASFGSAEETALFRDLRSQGLDAEHDGLSIVLVLGDDVLFASGSSQLNPKAHTLLKAMASVLKRYGSTQIDVEGYTDTAGSATFNLRLSQQRAKAVADVLMSEGVDAPRITTRGFGESFPRVPTRDGVNEPRNRRVEITLVPETREG